MQLVKPNAPQGEPTTKATLRETESQKEKRRQSHLRIERKTCKPLFTCRENKANGGRQWHRGYPGQWLLWCLALKILVFLAGLQRKRMGHCSVT